MFANDPYVRKFDAERVLCKMCETWVALGADDNAQAVRAWAKHKASCVQAKNASAPVAGPSSRYAAPAAPPFLVR